MKDNSGTKSRAGFLLVGNELALDFLNTRPVIDGEPTELLTDFKALLRWFEVTGLLGARTSAQLSRSPAKQREQTLDTMLAFRERLRTEIVRWEKSGKVSPAIIEELNRMMVAHPMPQRLKHESDGRLAIEAWFDPQQPAGLFAPLAQSAAKLFSTADHTRVRKCGQCVLHFHDTSKKGMRRWCSMQLCGNRLKVAAYAAREREKTRS